MQMGCYGTPAGVGPHSTRGRLTEDCCARFPCPSASLPALHSLARMPVASLSPPHGRGSTRCNEKPIRRPVARSWWIFPFAVALIRKSSSDWCALLRCLKTDLRMPGTDEAKLCCGSLGKIDDPPLDEGPPIIDADYHRLAITAIGDLHLCAEGQAAMGRGQCGG